MGYAYMPPISPIEVDGGAYSGAVSQPPPPAVFGRYTGRHGRLCERSYQESRALLAHGGVNGHIVSSRRHGTGGTGAVGPAEAQWPGACSQGHVVLEMPRFRLDEGLLQYIGRPSIRDQLWRSKPRKRRKTLFSLSIYPRK